MPMIASPSWMQTINSSRSTAKLSHPGGLVAVRLEDRQARKGRLDSLPVILEIQQAVLIGDQACSQFLPGGSKETLTRLR